MLWAFDDDIVPDLLLLMKKNLPCCFAGIAAGID